MNTLDQIKRPSKNEQKTALQSYQALHSAIEQLITDTTEIEIEETREKIVIPVRALKLLRDILKAMGQGSPISIVPVATEVTTQKAAEIIGCSRPHLVKLLDEGKIAFTKIGKHRRIKLEDVIKYKSKMKEEQKKHIIDIMNTDEEIDLYDS
ncbi:helix-turn-helix domain-containing protein [Gynurincola endophyticus]|uniref:helix-turn-helix domain-containing protein n=1 Tax=Gynurincola endophyticus TaxID=2479004 RepID=UPI000F8E807C|nr:helix-turn-helix domain-containing protein [Gynurincola endophyticus]